VTSVSLTISVNAYGGGVKRAQACESPRSNRIASAQTCTQTRGVVGRGHGTRPISVRRIWRSSWLMATSRFLISKALANRSASNCTSCSSRSFVASSRSRNSASAAKWSGPQRSELSKAGYSSGKTAPTPAGRARAQLGMARPLDKCPHSTAWVQACSHQLLAHER
jgi:hypothetical protein